MLRREIKQRPDLDKIAQECGFNFHTIDGEVYWDESRYYQFTLAQIENDLEKPTKDIHDMCLGLVDEVVNSEALLKKLAIPQHLWDWVAESWKNNDPSLYGRLDFAYGGAGSSAKLYELNYQTPTSIFEAAFFQWNWLSDQVERGNLARRSNQFNFLQEQLVHRFAAMKPKLRGHKIHFACAKDTDEDKGTVDYLRDCAHQAGLETAFVYVEDIGATTFNEFADINGNVIMNLFWLYPWEMAWEDPYSSMLTQNTTMYLEPAWKCILSNKGILPLLWERHRGHPNLLPSYFEGEEKDDIGANFVRKPLFSREGQNIDVLKSGIITDSTDGGYADIARITQAYHPLPKFGDDYTLIGSWVIGDEPYGLTIREDKNLITADESRFIPHIILD
jgi:glutathionylspermidine synthase